MKLYVCAMDTSFYIAGKVWSTKLTIISSYPTSMSGIIVLLDTKHLTLFMLSFLCKHFDCMYTITVSKVEFCSNNFVLNLNLD